MARVIHRSVAETFVAWLVTGPFGHLYGVTTVVDASLSGVGEIIFEGNTRHEGVRMRYRDYEAIAAPIRGRFASAIAPRRRRPSRRRVG